MRGRKKKRGENGGNVEIEGVWEGRRESGGGEFGGKFFEICLQNWGKI